MERLSRPVRSFKAGMVARCPFRPFYYRREDMKINQVQSQLPPKQLHMTKQVFTQICETIGMMPAEQGGILGGCRKDGVVEVTHFCFDETACERSGVAYTPNNTFLNNIIKTQWRP